MEPSVHLTVSITAALPAGLALTTYAEGGGSVGSGGVAQVVLDGVE
jgi:hypothetical protein